MTKLLKSRVPPAALVSTSLLTTCQDEPSHLEPRISVRLLLIFTFGLSLIRLLATCGRIKGSYLARCWEDPLQLSVCSLRGRTCFFYYFMVDNEARQQKNPIMPSIVAHSRHQASCNIGEILLPFFLSLSKSHLRSIILAQDDELSEVCDSNDLL